jgi:TRAP-type C4-dicarboxylate transport system permease small subunit
VNRFLPPIGARILIVSLDLVSLAFFLFLTWYGLGMTRDGLGQYATIFGITMVVPFAAVPVSSALTAFQILAAMLRSSEQSATGMARTR